MKALVLESVGNLMLKEVEKPIAKKDEVILKVEASGICNSDIDRVFKTGTYSFPLIPGHEFSGKIIEIGDGVDPSYLNKRATVFPLIPCGRCSSCKEGEYARCDNYNYFGSRCNGGFAEYLAVPIWNLVCFSDTLDYEQAAMCEPASVAHKAIMRSALSSSDSILIQGSGTIGLLIAMWALEKKVQNVVMVVRNKSKINLLNSLGIHKVIDLSVESEETGLQRLGLDNKVDITFDCVGSIDSVSSCIQSAKKGGKVVLVGNPTKDMMFDRNIYWKILRNELLLIGVWNSSYNAKVNDWKETISAMENGTLNLTHLIKHRFALNESKQAINILRSKNELAIKVMFKL